MRKKYKKGEPVITKRDMATLIASDSPYYYRKNLREIGNDRYTFWDSTELSHYYHAIEIVEFQPEKLGRLFICIKEHEDAQCPMEVGDLKVYPQANPTYLVPVTVDSKGNVWSCDE
tara:strand:- start:373 stop:720 length:348 start_codon:yes stop_codon:yes gene_type:complete